MRRGQNDIGRATGLEGFLPARRAQAPLIAGFESGKSGIGNRCRKIVAARTRKLQKLIGHARADGVNAHVARAGFAAAVAVPARNGIVRAIEERFAQDVFAFRCHKI